MENWKREFFWLMIYGTFQNNNYFNFFYCIIVYGYVHNPMLCRIVYVFENVYNRLREWTFSYVWLHFIQYIRLDNIVTF